MQLLDKSGAGGNYITNTFQSEEETAPQAQPAAPTRLLGRLANQAQAVLQSSLFAAYKVGRLVMQLSLL